MCAAPGFGKSRIAKECVACRTQLSHQEHPYASRDLAKKGSDLPDVVDAERVDSANCCEGAREEEAAAGECDEELPCGGPRGSARSRAGRKRCSMERSASKARKAGGWVSWWQGGCAARAVAWYDWRGQMRRGHGEAITCAMPAPAEHRSCAQLPHEFDPLKLPSKAKGKFVVRVR